MENNNFNNYFKYAIIDIKEQLKNNAIVLSNQPLELNVVKNINEFYSQFKPNITFSLNASNNLIVSDNKNLSECDLYLLFLAINLTKVKILKAYNIQSSLELDDILNHIDIAFLDKIKAILSDYLS